MVAGTSGNMRNPYKATGSVIIPSMINLNENHQYNAQDSRNVQESMRWYLQPTPSATTSHTIQMPWDDTVQSDQVVFVLNGWHTCTQQPAGFPRTFAKSENSSGTRSYMDPRFTHKVPISPELVNMPDRFPSSPGLYHLHQFTMSVFRYHGEYRKRS